jgi:hypothetical protein
MDIQQQPDESPMNFLAKQAQEMGLYDTELNTENKEKSWDDIFNLLERKLEIYLPIRAKNWLKNKYNSPTKKNDDGR